MRDVPVTMKTKFFLFLNYFFFPYCVTKKKTESLVWKKVWAPTLFFFSSGNSFCERWTLCAACVAWQVLLTGFIGASLLLLLLFVPFISLFLHCRQLWAEAEEDGGSGRSARAAARFLTLSPRCSHVVLTWYAETNRRTFSRFKSILYKRKQTAAEE